MKKQLQKDDGSTGLQRKLTPRLLNMIAIGGSIGTGIFLASGSAIALAGPAGVLTAYLLTGLMVFFLMTSLGEMAAYLPSSGSFYIYAAKYVDPALGYALGWNYWYNWAITVASEIVAASLVMQFWFPHSSSLLWCSAFLIIVVGLNLFSVKGFGEAEYWFSFIKVAVIIIFIFAGFAIVLGLTRHHALGFTNWKIPGAPFHNGWHGIIDAFMIAGFSFQGTELIGIAAGESHDPKNSLPKAVKQVFWRILLFFVLAIFVITLLVPFNSPFLTGNDVQTSPFTLVFKEYGIPYTAGIINFVVLIAIISAGNSGMYASTRMLWYLGKQGHVPAIFGRLNRSGIPITALLVTTLIALIAFLSSLFGNGVVYFWLLNASSLSGFIAWLGIAISHYRFRKIYLAEGGNLDDLPYRARGYPYAPLIAFAMCVLVILGQNYQAFTAKQVDWYGIVVAYIGVPIFLLIFIVYKWRHKTQWVRVGHGVKS